MKRIFLLSSGAILLAMAAIAFRGAARPSSGFDEAAQLIAVRAAGHELLRSVGDSSSPLPPVQVKEPGTYLLSFPSAFAFLPDSLQAVVDRALASGAPGSDYIVKMVERPSGGIVFGYSVLASKGQTLVPCLGRTQAERRYDLLLQFRGPAQAGGRNIPAAASGLLAVGLLLAGFRRPRRRPRISHPAPAPESATPPASTALGRYHFLPAQQCLLLGEERITLTGKEAALLSRLAARPNELIERSELQKIWEDEGVIVGRSLDVFVSRLRKKLERDPALALVSVTGKGYRLEMKKPMA